MALLDPFVIACWIVIATYGWLRVVLRSEVVPREFRGLLLSWCVAVLLPVLVWPWATWLVYSSYRDSHEFMS